MTLNEEIPHPVLRAFIEEEDVEKEELPLLFSMSIIVVFSGVRVTWVLHMHNNKLQDLIAALTYSLLQLLILYI